MTRNTHPLPAIPLLFLMAVAGCGPKAPATGDDAVREAGEAAFSACAACHSVQPGERRAGPSLHGVVGRRAGSLPGFAYSSAMRSAGFVWDRARLEAFIEHPATYVKGTRMGFGGVADPAQRHAIVRYLETLK